MSNSLSPIIHALERAYTAIRMTNPDAQLAVITVYRRESGQSWGYFHKSQFINKRESGQRLDEIQIDSTLLKESARMVLCILLHEACHSVASHREVQDTSRQGRYHNRRFVEIAQEAGLVTQPDKRIGCTTPNMTDQTAQRYRTVIDELEQALTLYQEPPLRNGPTRRKSRMLKAQCPACERVIRGSQKTFDAGPVICQPCASPFQVEEPEDG